MLYSVRTVILFFCVCTAVVPCYQIGIHRLWKCRSSWNPAKNPTEFRRSFVGLLPVKSGGYVRWQSAPKFRPGTAGTPYSYIRQFFVFCVRYQVYKVVERRRFQRKQSLKSEFCDGGRTYLYLQFSCCTFGWPITEILPEERLPGTSCSLVGQSQISFYRRGHQVQFLLHDTVVLHAKRAMARVLQERVIIL